MSLSVCVLGSGSTGNCTWVASETTAVLIDAGLSCKETLRRIEEDPSRSMARVKAVLVTHEHDDHVSGLGTIHRRYQIPIYSTSGTINAVERHEKFQGLTWTVFAPGQSFTVGDLTIHPFTVPHDAYDPVAFAVSQGEHRMAVLTDLGMPTALIRERLKGCQVIVMETNHDEQMLKDADRPWSLKQRIASNQGHLSNAQACEIITSIADVNLRHVYLAHLSQDCNHPQKAFDAMTRALQGMGCGHVSVGLTYAERPSEVWSLQPA
jgi:phosphoribosyl 1,2-cyclic phosphodiesterase